MIRGVQTLAEQTQRQRRGGLTTLARLGGEAMTAPARAGFRKRFEREALALAQTQGRTLNQRQLDEATTALMKAHMALMTERRLKKRYELAQRDGQTDRLRQHAGLVVESVEEIEALMAEAERKALGDDPAEVRALRRMVEPVQLCVGCWVELCAGEAFPAEATSTLCARHLESFRLTMLGSDPSCEENVRTQSAAKGTRGATPPKQARQKQRQIQRQTPPTRRAPVCEHERSRDLNHRPVHQSL